MGGCRFFREDSGQVEVRLHSLECMYFALGQVTKQLSG